MTNKTNLELIDETDVGDYSVSLLLESFVDGSKVYVVRIHDAIGGHADIYLSQGMERIEAIKHYFKIRAAVDVNNLLER